MRKLSVFILGASLSFAFAFCGGNVVKVSAEEKTVYIGGMSAGFTLKSGSTQIIGMCEVMSEKGVSSPALEAGLRSGDHILSVGGIRVNTIGELNEIVNKRGDKPLNLEILRGKDLLNITVTPIKDKVTNCYKIGVLVRDSISGIGTVTYIDEKGKFGSLGHSVVGENSQNMQISDGIVYECSIVGVCKGVRGKAGELRGMFLNDKTFGNAEKMSDCGIFGHISKDYETNNLLKTKADSSDVKPGDAYIYSTVSGECTEKYKIEIVKVDKNNKEHKNYVIKITDDKLISETGGIVQGMSGSPIIQEDKLVGAVTHVFLNDPTRGYGIDIRTMLAE